MAQNIGETTFYEKINIKKLNYILNNRSKYESIITEQEKEMRRTDKHYKAYAVFQKIKENILIPNELKDTDVIREQFSIILAQEVNDLYESEYIVVESTTTKNIIKDFISDKNIYFYMDDKTKQGIEFFIIKKHELDTLNYLGLDNCHFIDEKPLKFVQGW
jgi:hypothetical protein